MHAQGHPQQLQIPRQTDRQTNKLQLTHKQITTTHREHYGRIQNVAMGMNNCVDKFMQRQQTECPHTHSHSYNTNPQYGRLQQIAL